MKTLGLIEVVGFSTAVYVADVMVKTADIVLERVEKTKGQGWMTVYVSGDVGAVNAAISAGEDAAAKKQRLVTTKVIARAASELEASVLKTDKKADKKANQEDLASTSSEAKSSTKKNSKTKK